MTQCEALLAIANRNGGLITPAAVIAEARDPASVLHGAFTWDDTAAARKWRIHEAQCLIRECRVTVERDGRSETTFAFVGVSSDRTGPSANNPYRRAQDVASDGDLMAVATRDALAQLKAFKERYEHLKALRGVWDAIDAAG